MTGPQPGHSSACTVSCRSCSGRTRWSRFADAAAPGDVQLPPRPGVPRLRCHQLTASPTRTRFPIGRVQTLPRRRHAPTRR
jgi:hypothetical protein